MVIFSSILITNPTIKDRYVDQIITQAFDKNKNFNLKEYKPMYETSIKMFKQNPILGIGPKGYRYHCNEQPI